MRIPVVSENHIATSIRVQVKARTGDEFLRSMVRRNSELVVCWPESLTSFTKR
jgi:hypothetical protein